MSLSSLLSNDAEVKQLFKQIPNMKKSFQTLNEGEVFPKNHPIVVPNTANSPSLVGQAIDYWLRAYIQQINMVLDESFNGTDLVAYLGLEDYLKTVKTKKEKQKHIQLFNEIIKRRLDYNIYGEIDEKQFVKDCLMLGNLDTILRGRNNPYMPEINWIEVNEKDEMDLLNLISENQKMGSFFKKKHTLICNPKFRHSSLLVGGADADLLIDDTLIDFKTESQFKYKGEHVKQLIGYYILSLMDETFPVIHKLAIYNPRYCQYVYITIDDIKTHFDLFQFANEFIGILHKRTIDTDLIIKTYDTFLDKKSKIEK